jgi:hypothetical protein
MLPINEQFSNSSVDYGVQNFTLCRFARPANISPISSPCQRPCPCTPSRRTSELVYLPPTPSRLAAQIILFISAAPPPAPAAAYPANSHVPVRPPAALWSWSTSLRHHHASPPRSSSSTQLPRRQRRPPPIGPMYARAS